MTVVGLVALLVFTFGAFVYGAILLLWLREVGRGWTGTATGQPRRSETELVGGAMLAVSFVWFVLNLFLTLQDFGPVSPGIVGQLAAVWLALAFPPLIMHVTLLEVTAARRRKRAPEPSGRWRWPLRLMYPATLFVALTAVLAAAGVITMPGPAIGALISYAIAISFIAAAVYALLLITRGPASPATVREGQARGWTTRLFGFMGLLFATMFVLSSADGPVTRPATLRLLDVTARSLPLMFIFVGTYYENRFGFFDIFVKRGLSLLVTVGLLTVAFAVALPLLGPYGASVAAPWIYAIVLLPVVGILPWLHDRLAATLDRRWLGRRFSTVDAVKRFFNELHPATDEAQLVARAEASLAEIFAAPARVQLGPAAEAPGFTVAQQVSIPGPGRDAGRVLLGTRASEAPYFREDLALAGSLADVFASLLQNVRLQARRHEQEQLAREMALQASRSELKALRAQINPHFLFNALNAIAGLIHRDPAEADRTVEQLADVFRYALRGSQEEWARLEDELDFVRAYLAVEQARFGARLRVEVRLAPAAAAARVPTLALQTLVENAVKHGASAVVGQALVEIDARVEGDRLVVTVADNGPGLEAALPPASAEEGGPLAPSPAGGGYGLPNVRRRLDGYFGGAASLEIRRDRERALTIATLTMPLQVRAPGAAPALAEHPR